MNRLVGRSLALALALVSVLPATAGAALPPVKGGGPLSPLLGLLARPSVNEKAPSAQDRLLGVSPEEAGGLVRDGDRVQVTARFAGGAIGELPQLRAVGGRVVSADPEQQTVTLAVAPEDLAAVAAVPGVRAVWQMRRPITYGIGEGPCEGGSVLSEGLGQLRVDAAREAFDLRGRGITIGVLSDSYDAATEAAGGGAIATHAHADVESNDLPGLASSCSDQQLPVDVLAEGDAEGADEGRAMLQIVHDLAPHAKLAFATAFESEESFASNIEALARPVSAGGAGAEVIVDDVAWLEEPFFQDGPIAAAIDKVTGEGVTYLTATGNDNLFDSGGNEVASWEAPEFRDSGGCPAAVAILAGFNGKHCMDFNPGAGTDRTFGITVEAGETLTVDLQWAEPWNGVLTDIDAFLLSDGGELLTHSAEENNGPAGTQRPVEVVQWVNESTSARTVQLAINRFSGVNPRLKFILMENGSGVSATEYPGSGGGDVVGPSIFGHAGAAAAISVAAVPFNDSAEVEPYSSRGPVIHYFGPVEGAIPALPLGSPEEVAKPDLAATDCGATTFFAFLAGGTWRFCGTSAAAPHAAAVAALVRQAKPSLPTHQVRDAMTDTATPVGAFTADAAGAGLIDAFAAIGGLPGPVEGGDDASAVVPPLEKGAGGSSVKNGPSATETVIPTPEPPQVQPARAPNTSILRHPAKVVHALSGRARVVFRFGSDQSSAAFLCKLDAAAFHLCPPRLVRRVRPGRHVLRVKARAASGLVDPTPVVFRFRIEPN